MIEQLIKYPQAYTDDMDLPLSDTALEVDYPALELSKKVSENVDPLDVKLRLLGKYQVSVYNQLEDKDNDHIFSKKLAEAYPESCFVKAVSSGRLKGLTAQLSNLDFGIKGDSELSFFDYRRYPKTTTFSEALTGLRTGYRNVLWQDHVLAMAPGESLGISWEGNLSASLELSVSDVYSMGLNVLKQLLPSGKSLRVNVKPSLSLAFSCSLSDSFLLEITRQDQYAFGVSVKKSKARKMGLEGKVSVAVGAHAPKEWTDVLNEFLTSLLDTSITQWDALLDKELEKWSETEKALASYVIKRLGWDVDLSDTQIVKKQYEQLKTDLSEKLQEYLKQEIALEIKLAYERTVKGEAVIEATFSQEALVKAHKALIKGRWDKLAGIEGIAYNKFLLTHIEQRETRWGIGLKLGDLHLFSRGNYDYKKEENTDYAGDVPVEHVCITAQRAHEDKGVDGHSYFIQLKGETPGYVPKAHAGVFDFQWQTHWETTQRRIRAGELDDYVDWAVLWNCIPESDRKSLTEHWRDEVKGERHIHVSLDLTIPNGVFDMLVPLLQAPPEQYIVQSLAESMPYLRGTMRETLRKRAAVYFRIWDQYLQLKVTQPQLMARIAGELLEAVDPELAEWEVGFADRNLTADDGWKSMAGIVGNNYLFDDIRRLQLGMGHMHQAMVKHKHYDIPFSEGFKKYKSLLLMTGMNKTFNIRFMGRYLLNLASKAGVSEEIKTTFGIKLEGDQQELVTSS